MLHAEEWSVASNVTYSLQCRHRTAQVARLVYIRQRDRRLRYRTISSTLMNSTLYVLLAMNIES